MRNIWRMWLQCSEEEQKKHGYHHHILVREQLIKIILRKKLRGILNKMTPEKFAKIAAQTMDVVKVFAENKEMMDIIIEVVLGFAIQIPVFGDQYAKLCQHLKAHLPKLGMVCEFQWVLDDPDLSNTFRQTVIIQTNNLFREYLNHSPDDIDLDDDGKKIQDFEYLELKKSKLKNNFFAVMTLVAELYNVELVNSKVIYRGIFDTLLPPKNNKLSSIDLEGLCRLFQRCGKTLDKAVSRDVDRYIQKLRSHARKFDFRTKVLVDGIVEMRKNRWKARIKKEKAKTMDEIKEEFDEQQGTNYNSQRSGYSFDTYDDEDYNVGYNAPQQSLSYNNNTNRSSRNTRSRRNRTNSRYIRTNNNGGNNHPNASKSLSNLNVSGRRYRRARYNDNESQGSNDAKYCKTKPTVSRRLIYNDVNDFDVDDDNNNSKKNNENEWK